MELHIIGSPEEIATLLLELRRQPAEPDADTIEFVDPDHAEAPAEIPVRLSGDKGLIANIKTLCVAKGISIAKLERECDLGNATIRRWEDEDRSPSLESVRRVADYFDVSVDFLLGRTTSAEK